MSLHGGKQIIHSSPGQWLVAQEDTAKIHRMLKIGLVGLDTSHVVAFSKLLNDAANPEHLSGARGTHGEPGGAQHALCFLPRRWRGGHTWICRSILCRITSRRFSTIRWRAVWPMRKQFF